MMLHPVTSQIMPQPLPDPQPEAHLGPCRFVALDFEPKVRGVGWCYGHRCFGCVAHAPPR